MMKIQTHEASDAVILHVEGRLAGIFVPELENCWRAARLAEPARKVAVDLRNVTCVDRGGRRLLQAMYDEGVDFVAAGLSVQDILEQIKESPECSQ